MRDKDAIEEITDALFYELCHKYPKFGLVNRRKAWADLARAIPITNYLKCHTDDKIFFIEYNTRYHIILLVKRIKGDVRDTVDQLTLADPDLLEKIENWIKQHGLL